MLETDKSCEQQLTVFIDRIAGMNARDRKHYMDTDMEEAEDMVAGSGMWTQKCLSMFCKEF
jgi:hypothetical protein